MIDYNGKTVCTIANPAEQVEKSDCMKVCSRHSEINQKESQ